MKNNIHNIIKKVSTNPFKTSQTWDTFNLILKDYLQNGELDFYKINNIEPRIFHWPELSEVNIMQFSFLEKNKDSVFYKTIVNNNDYGPIGVNLFKNIIQLDRVQQVWSVYNLVNILNLNLNDEKEIILEFGGGTGQMADVLSDLNFKGKHIVYDIPLMTVLQSYFVSKKNIENHFILDDEELNIIHSTNYLPCNQSRSEKTIMAMPNINFIATHSLSETDIHTHAKFAEYIINYSRIFVTYNIGNCGQTVTDDQPFVLNENYFQFVKQKLEFTHYCYIGKFFENNNIFIAVKRELMPDGFLKPTTFCNG